MKRSKTFLYFCSLVVLLFISACSGGGNEGDASQSNSNSTSSESTHAADPVHLKIASVWPGPHIQHKEVIEPLIEEIEKITEGRVTAELFPADALGPATENFDMATTGVADIGLGLHGTTPGTFNITGVIELPFMSESAEQGSRIYRGLLDAFPDVFAEEHTGTKIVYLFQGDGSHILTIDAPVHKPEDLKGLRLRSPSPAANKVLEAFGAIPVSMPMGELYEAMQRGVVDGALAPASAFENFQLAEVANYITIAHFYGSSFFAVMNENTWNQITPADQEALDEIFVEYGFKSGKTYDDFANVGWQSVAENGVEVFEIPADEKRIWNDVLDPLAENWIAEMEALGKPGREVYEEAIRLRDELTN